MLRQVLEMWRIPLIKRATQTLSMVSFIFVFASVCFQPLCGDLNASHYLFAVWMGCLVVQARRARQGGAAGARRKAPSACRCWCRR